MISKFGTWFAICNAEGAMFLLLSRVFMLAAVGVFFALIFNVMVTPVGCSAKEAFMLRIP
ncbi:MAG: hypothetical protein AB7F75_09185 [Planctomycetota bacterium]